MRATKRGLLASLISLVTLLFSLRVRADPSDQKATAQVLFDQARVLVELGNFAAACPKFAESQRIDPGIGTMLWLADCYENSGQTASAWASFKAAGAMAALRHDERQRIARERAASLEPRLTRLKVTVAGDAPQGLQVRRDGLLVESAEWLVPMPVDPGDHAITADAPGFRAWTTSVHLSSHDALRQVTVPPLAPNPAYTKTVGAYPSDPSIAAQGDHRGSVQRVAGLGTAGAGIAAILAGAFVSLRAKATYDESTDGTAPHCAPDNECDAAGTAYRSEANSMATAAAIAMGAGAAAMVGGAVLYFTAPKGVARAVAFAPARSGGSVRVGWGW